MNLKSFKKINTVKNNKSLVLSNIKKYTNTNVNSLPKQLQNINITPISSNINTLSKTQSKSNKRPNITSTNVRNARLKLTPQKSLSLSDPVAGGGIKKYKIIKGNKRLIRTSNRGNKYVLLNKRKIYV